MFCILIFPDFLSLSFVAFFLCARVGEGSFLIYLKKKTVHLTADISSENVHNMHSHKTLSRKERLAAWKSAKGANGENSMAGTNGSGIAKKTRAKKKVRVAATKRRVALASPPPSIGEGSVLSAQKKKLTSPSERAVSVDFLSQSAKKLNSIKSRLLLSAKKRKARADSVVAIPSGKTAVRTATKPKRPSRDYQSTVKKVKDKNLNTLIDSEAKVALEYASMGNMKEARTYMKELKDQFKATMEMGLYWTTVAAMERKAGCIERTITAYNLGLHFTRQGAQRSIVQTAANEFWSTRGLQLSEANNVDEFFSPPAAAVAPAPAQIDNDCEVVTKQLCFDDTDAMISDETEKSNDDTDAIISDKTEKSNIAPDFIEEASPAQTEKVYDEDDGLAAFLDAEVKSSSTLSPPPQEPEKQQGAETASEKPKLVRRTSSLLRATGKAQRVPTPCRFGKDSLAAQRVLKSPNVDDALEQTPRKLSFAPTTEATNGSVVVVQAVRASGKKATHLGARMTATPVRRSARHIREKDAPSSIAARMDVLRAVDFAYAPNPMLDVMKDVMAEADARERDENERLRMREEVMAEASPATSNVSADKEDTSSSPAVGSFTITLEDGMTPIVVRRSALNAKTPLDVREEMERALAGV